MLYSRKKISRAGNTMITSTSKKDVDEAIVMINEWRASHAFVLDQLKPMLVELFESFGIEPLFSSRRLKRMTSIQYKLDLNPEMGLGGMQDIGGLRFVFQDVDTLEKAYELIQKKIPQHFVIYKKDDYVNGRPKPSGYRSIHIVYQYCSDDERYNGLRVELQIRTKLQHNWATAVETAGLTTNTSLKSSQGDSKWLIFFKIVSCLMAMKEQKPIIEDFEKYSMEKLMQICFKMDEMYKFTDTLRAIRITVKSVEEEQYSDDFYLVIIDFTKSVVNVSGFKDSEQEEAFEKYAIEESTAQEGLKAVVLVSVDNIRDLKEAYPSYFLDTSEFIHVLEMIKSNCRKNWQTNF